MDTRLFRQVLVSLALVSLLCAQQRGRPGAKPLSSRILDLGEAEQLAYLDVRLNQGLRPVDDDAMTRLLLGRSSLVIPIIERKIEEVLKAPNRQGCFTDPQADPETFLAIAASNIAWVGDENSLKAASKLLALDENRFDLMVRNTFYATYGRRNPVTLAYKGIEMGDPAVQKRIVAWVEADAAFEASNDASLTELKGWWAEAMLEKYHGVPIDADWRSDPIASRIDRALADSLRDDILRRAAQIASTPGKN